MSDKKWVALKEFELNGKVYQAGDDVPGANERMAGIDLVKLKTADVDTKAKLSKAEKKAIKDAKEAELAELEAKRLEELNTEETPLTEDSSDVDVSTEETVSTDES
jgi:hypothetical protein